MQISEKSNEQILKKIKLQMDGPTNRQLNSHDPSAEQSNNIYILFVIYCRDRGVHPLSL